MDVQTNAEVSLSPTHPRAEVSFPVLMKEMRSRMRGNRAPALLALVTGMTILVGLLILFFAFSDLDWNSPSAAYRMSEAGKALFIGLLIAEAVLIALIAPALTAGAISIEREKQTLELLLLTRLSNLNIVMGKYLSSLGFVLILLVCTLPVMAISFFLGGVAPAQLGWSLALLLSLSLLFGAIGLYCSARTQKTASAVVATYAICLGWPVVAPMVLFPFLSYSHYSDNYSSAEVIIHMLIFAGLAAAVTALISGLCAVIPRCALSGFSQLIIWLCITGAVTSFFFLSSLSDLFKQHEELYLCFFFGNPFFVGATIFVGDDIFSGGFGPSAGAAVLTWIVRHIVLLAIGLYLLWTLAFLSLTAHRVRLARREQ